MTEAHDMEIARRAVREALQAGATAADVVLVDSEGTSVSVRDGAVERVQDSRSRGLGVRAFRGTQMGIAYTNDVTPDAARETARRAAALSEIAAEDEAAGLPAAADLGALEDDLDLEDPGAGSWSAETWRDRALRAEEAAREDERITMSEGVRAGGGRSRVLCLNSAGFEGDRRVSHCYTGAGMFATGDQGERQRAHYGTTGAHLDQLRDPEYVGRETARRAIERCGYRKPPTGEFPVVFSPQISRDFAYQVAGALSAAAVYRRGTFLADRFGEQVAASALTLVDDGTLPRRLGSRPFDGEGVRGRRTVLLDAGRLASWLADSYAARRTGFHTTGNASRSVGGTTSVSTTNLVLEAGERPPEAVIGDVEQGLYVTDLFGFGVNLPAGTWSRGGSGRWIENGQLTYPVQELTVAGDMRTILTGFREAANDLEWEGKCAAPTVRIDGFTVAAG